MIEIKHLFSKKKKEKRSDKVDDRKRKMIEKNHIEKHKQRGNKTGNKKTVQVIRMMTEEHTYKTQD